MNFTKNLKEDCEKIHKQMEIIKFEREEQVIEPFNTLNDEKNI